jgi:outer membrane protein OmpA-like peptidoglycan-associated protein
MRLQSVRSAFASGPGAEAQLLAPKRDASPAPPAHNLLSLQQQAGNQAVQQLLRSGIVRAKLAISEPNDPEEREADQVADRVMRAPAGFPISSSSSCSCSADGENCEECRQKPGGTIARKPAGGANPATSHHGVEHILRSSGQPLDIATRAFFEPRFGRDFSRVRVHTSDAAAESARSIAAHAYTLGRDVVFAPGKYNPQTSAGQSLLAHELAHTIQQKPDGVFKRPDSMPHLSQVQSRIQRSCGTDLHDPKPDCTASDTGVIGQQFLFVVNCDDLQPGEAGKVTRFAAALKPGAHLNIHGFASEEGPVEFNLALSCHRANVIAGMLQAARPDCTISANYKHGAHGGPPLRDFWRSVIVEEVKPQPEPPKPGPVTHVCGPDVTDWFLDQVARAKKDPAVLEIKANLEGAQRVAAANGFSADQVAEGGIAKRVLAEEGRVGSPARTADARSQLHASEPSQAAFGRARLASTVPLAGAPEALVLAAIRRASLLWKGVVGTKKRYDFKNNSMKAPLSANCPVDCAHSITFCSPGAENCFGADLPGNIFYAHLGRFAGFTQLALQLGSQFAQLESSSHWDPPEDTAMISTGFGLPDPLDRSALCAAVGSLGGAVNHPACTTCAEPFSE